MTLSSDIARMIGISPESCRRIAIGAHRRYKVFYIPKRQKGLFRLVAQPAREVKSLQRAIVEVLSPQLPIHEAATAYKAGSSILENARRHAGARFLTKLDFKAFFPSIDGPAIAKLLKKSIKELTDSDVKFVLDACLWKGENGSPSLCIGAPSSPLLSNAVMCEFDAEVAKFAVIRGVVYTRYSDDISISCSEPDVLNEVEAFIISRCKESEHPRLALNETKRVAVSRGAAMNVTGLTLTNQGGVSVGRVRKRGVRAGVDRYLEQGMTLDEARVLRGELAFVLSIEPDFRKVLVATYGFDVLALLPRA